MTAPQIRCLLAILALSEACEHIESKDIAHLLGVKRPTVHNMLVHLQEKSLIEKEHYGDVHLSEAGRHLARRLETHRDDLTLLFSKGFGLPPEESAKAAIILVGELTEDSLKKLRLERAVQD